MINPCPLCNSSGKVFYQNKKQLFYQCSNCYGIYVDKNLKPDKETEKARYKKHNNDVNDKNYQNFVSDITLAIIRDFTKNDKGLDFGAGSGPVISKILNDNNFNIVQYDPFFYDNPSLLAEKYNYIACCEVAEHFYNPQKEFNLLKKMLKQNGKLYIMTDLYDESIDFNKWYYKNDITHVFIYHKKTIQWIKNTFKFLDVKIKGRLIIFYN